MLKHCAVVATAKHFLYSRRAGLSSYYEDAPFCLSMLWQTKTKASFKMASGAIKAC